MKWLDFFHFNPTLKKLILLLGGTGYIGQAFHSELTSRRIPFHAVSRSEVDYTCFPILRELIRSLKPSFLINCAGYTGKPNVDACESAKADTLAGNSLFPQTLAHACEVEGLTWGHVSSGCIFSGAKIRLANGSIVVEKDMSRGDLRHLAETQPESIMGYTELDTPNFTFRDSPCSFYSGTKALGEEVLARSSSCYIWRLRIPFDAEESPRNYLRKVQRYAKVYDNLNSISHRGDFAKACLDLWQMRAPTGLYNVTNPGWITTRQVVQRITTILKLSRGFEYWESDEAFYQTAAITPRSNCILDTTKLRLTGVKLRSVQDALDDSLRCWKTTSTA